MKKEKIEDRKIKIKIIKTERDNRHGYCDCCDSGSDPIFTSIMQWDEVDLKKYGELSEAVRCANNNQKDPYHYSIIQQVDIDNCADIFKSADEYIKYQKNLQEQYKKREAADKIKREKTKKEREARQLEKLKQKLKQLEGEQNDKVT